MGPRSGGVGGCQVGRRRARALPALATTARARSFPSGFPSARRESGSRRIACIHSVSLDGKRSLTVSVDGKALRLGFRQRVGRLRGAV